MEDLSSNELFQQHHARAVSGEDLEVLGKRASAGWSDGKYESLNDAVVETVKHAGLSPEQVRRVVEFTNTNAFLQEFRKEGGSKYVDFGSPGPADPRAILQDLNDGGGGSVFDPGTGDYHQPPDERKTASDDSVLAQAFSALDVGLPEHNPLGEVLELRDKLASAVDNYRAEIGGCEYMVDELRGRLFHTVKQAALSGHSLGEIANIWERYAPDPEYVKLAFDMIVDGLVDNGVFFSTRELVESLQKTASESPTPNPAHPLVVDFGDFCSVVEKLAQIREDHVAVKKGYDDLTLFLKSANTVTEAATAVAKAAPHPYGLAGKAVDLTKRVAGGAEHYGTRFGNAVIGAEHGKHVGTAAKWTALAAPVVAGHEVYRRTVKHSPLKSGVLAAVPGTQEYNNKEYQLMSQAQGMPQY